MLITRGGRKRVGRGGEGSLVFLIKVCLFFYLGWLLGFTHSEPFWFFVGKFQLSFVVGCVRHLNIPFGFLGVLVYWINT